MILLIPPDSMLVFLSILAVTYSIRLVGFFAPHNRALSKCAAAVMETTPGRVLVSVIALYFVSDKLHEPIIIVLIVLAASRLPILPIALIGVAASGLFGYLS